MSEYLAENLNKHKLSFPGKIAVITSHVSQNKEIFHSVKDLIMKYGVEKIIHKTWPENFIAEKAKMIDTAIKLAEDREVKVLIINQALLGTNDAVDKLKETRDDIFIIYCSAHDPIPEAAVRANLMFRPNELGMGEAMVHQAKKQGAKVFIHYSSPRHMSMMIMSNRRSLIQETCMNEGLLFVDATALDHQDEAGIDGARQFILEDVPKMVAKYGEDTAFFCTNCNLQMPLIKAVIENHAIYPQPCCPSPFHGFPEALGIETGEGVADLTYVISEACRIAEEKNMTDRLSTWPISAPMMFVNAGAEYAIKWIKGDVPKTGIDNKVLAECMGAYVEEVVGEASNVYMSSYSENGITYENYKMILMSYLDF